MLRCLKDLSFLLTSLLLTLGPLSFSASAQEHQGRLWAITGEKVKDTSYLYGTIHIMDEKAYRFPEGTREAFRSVDAYAGELNMDSVNQMTLMSQLRMKDSTTLDDLLSDEGYQDVKKYVEDSLGMPMNRFKSFHPMLILSRAQMMSFEQDCTMALDMYFHSMAKDQGKEVIGLERMSEQVDAFHSLPYDSLAERLVKIARGEAEKKKGKGSMQDMLNHYVEGDLDAILEMNQTQGNSEKFKKVFLTERNVRMADRAARKMKDKSLFIGVGAAHLPGSKGVIELLRDKGLTVRSISGNGKSDKE